MGGGGGYHMDILQMVVSPECYPIKIWNIYLAYFCITLWALLLITHKSRRFGLMRTDVYMGREGRRGRG